MLFFFYCQNVLNNHLSITFPFCGKRKVSKLAKKKKKVTALDRVLVGGDKKSLLMYTAACNECNMFEAYSWISSPTF